MRLTLQLFALARERAGRSFLELDVPEAATVAAVKAAAVEACPPLAPLMAHVRIAVNSEYADDSQTIPPGSEVAAIPPVSGG